MPHNLVMDNYWVSSQLRRGRALFSVRLHTHCTHPQFLKDLDPGKSRKFVLR